MMVYGGHLQIVTAPNFRKWENSGDESANIT
jgi:hypothetical protein